MVILSVTGVVRTLLIIIGIIVLMRLIGKVMIAKRNMEEHEKTKRQNRHSDEMVEDAKKNYGRTTITKIGKSAKTDDFAEYEEIKED